MIKISVIVPVYNVEKYLDKCLASLINQTFKDYEIIIVNDGSPDDSQTIIDKYKKQYPNKIKAYQKENGGLSSARNFGLNKSEGKYIAFIDSDDYVTTDFLKKLYDKITENDYDIAVCDVESIEENQTEIILGINNVSEDTLINFILSPPSAPNKLYKKDLFQNDTLFPMGLYYEDLGTTPKLLKYASKIGYLNEPLYKYLIRDGSIIHQKKFNPKIADIFIILDNLYQFYKENHLLEKYYDEIEFIYINQLIHNFGLRFLEFSEGNVFIPRIKKEIAKKFPKWTKNKYFKKYGIKKKIMCYLIYQNKIKIINILRRK